MVKVSDPSSLSLRYCMKSAIHPYPSGESLGLSELYLGVKYISGEFPF